MKRKIERAFALLERIPVSGGSVDLMHEVRLILSEVHTDLREQEKGDGKNA